MLEAFGAQLPVVATSVGGVAGLADGCALLIPPDDPYAAARELTRLADDEALRRRLVEIGLERARSHTLEAERQRIVDFIEATNRAMRPTRQPDEPGG